MVAETGSYSVDVGWISSPAISPFVTVGQSLKLSTLHCLSEIAG